jgi:hypothetical protein
VLVNRQRLLLGWRSPHIMHHPLLRTISRRLQRSPVREDSCFGT